MPLTRPQAQRRLLQHEERFGAAQLAFAAHAALPVVLDARLVHLLRINFFYDGAYPLPWTAEIDLLFSPLVTDLGDGVYEIDPNTRALLLERLAAGHGHARMVEIASLIWAHLHQRPAPWAHEPGLEKAQELTALQFIDPEACEQWLARAEDAVHGDAVAERSWFVAMRRRIEPTLAAGRVRRPSWARFNGLRVLVVGTGGRSKVSTAQALASVALGRALAHAGFGVVCGGWPGVDDKLATSYLTAARSLDDAEGHLEQVITHDRKLSFLGGEIVRVPSGEDMDAAIERANAVVLIGGHEWTLETFERALVKGKPVFPLRATGGSASTAFKALDQLTYRPYLAALELPASTAAQAELLASRVVEALQARLAAPREVEAPRPPQAPEMAPASVAYAVPESAAGTRPTVTIKKANERRIKLLLFKEVSDGDVRKFGAIAADADTGRGARDLRFPHEAFAPIFARLLPRAVPMMAGRKKTEQVDVRCGTIRWYERNNEHSAEIEYWPPNKARPTEGRWAKVNRISRFSAIPPEGNGRRFVLLIQYEDDSVWLDVVTESSLRNKTWNQDVASRILACAGNGGRGVQGYIDFETNKMHCHGPWQMSRRRQHGDRTDRARF